MQVSQVPVAKALALQCTVAEAAEMQWLDSRVHCGIAQPGAFRPAAGSSAYEHAFLLLCCIPPAMEAADRYAGVPW